MSPRNVIQSYKKVINIAPASVAAGVANPTNIVVGVDSVAAGQTSATDANCPTGCLVKFIEMQFTISNLVAVTMNVHYAVEYILSGQAFVNPNVIGGSPIRNQVLKQGLFMVGKEQNSNHVIRFKIPSKFQRLREGMAWKLIVQADQVSSQTGQHIYKFYR